jgi:hypothetical protein
MTLPKHVYAVKDRHGKIRYRFIRKNMASAYLRGEPGSPQFMATYDAWRSGNPPAKVERPLRKFRGIDVVYFVGPMNGLVKIGTTNDLERRLSRLQTGSGQKLLVWAVTKGGLALEAKYHRRFAASRAIGEWFERTAALQSEIDRIIAGGVFHPSFSNQKIIPENKGKSAC